jgi:5-methylcytosine-specific restriction protein B
MGEEITNEENEMANWIEEAKQHFENITSDENYANYEIEDENSQKSKEINEKLKKLVEDSFNDKELIIDKNGNKWGKQGHRTLSSYIWYRIFYKDFGKNYPIVINASIDKDGLHCYIDIYDKVLHNNENLKKKLGEILDEILQDKLSQDDDFIVKEEENDKYNFGYVDIKTEDEFKEKVQKIVDIFKEIAKKINEEIFDKTIGEFNTFLENPSDITHLNFDKNGKFYKTKISIKENFETFLETPTYANLKWWDESINAANMQGNLTNLIKKVEGLTLEEVKSLKDENELIEIQNIFKKIKDAIFDENGNIRENLTYVNIEEIVKNIDGMNATAKELAYYIQMQEDEIPLVNGMTEWVIRHIEQTTDILKDKYTIQDKIDTIKEKIRIPDNFEFKSYYVVDQFFNLLHKITYKDIQQVEDSYKNLFLYAYLFSNLLGKADKKGVEKDDFVDELKKSKNIIYYGAPGTGKTYPLRENIKSIVDDEEKQFVMTQFHPSYSYEDFIEGVKPTGIENEVMNFELQDGEFKRFCDRAKVDEENFEKEIKKDFNKAISKYGYFFFVDEINRAELSRVFGELLYSLEYRGKEGKIKTQYSSMRDDNIYFYIPQNLFFVGTMNDIDRSIDSFDLALRRRFLWIKKECDYNVIQNDETLANDESIGNYIEACKKLNEYVVSIDGLGEKYQIGHAYFIKIKNFIKSKITRNAMNELFEYHIEPLLTEYLRTAYAEQEIKKKIDEARKIFKLKKQQ